MEFISFLVFCYLIYSHFSIRGRVKSLEERIERRDYAQPTVANNVVAKTTISDIPIRPIQPNGEPFAERLTREYPDTFRPETSATPLSSIPVAVRSERPVETPSEFFLFAWFREQTLIKVGSIIFFLGALWFVGYAIEQNWISPLTRIALGLLLACAVYAVGFLRKETEVTQYQTLTVLGTGIFLATVTASQFAFLTPVLPASFAFLLMVGSICYTLFVALQTKTQWLAVVASLAGLVGPFLINFQNENPVLLLSYLLLLSACFLVVAFFTSWRAVSLTLLVGTALHTSMVGGATALSDNALWFFVILFSILFFTSTTVSVVSTKKPVMPDVVSVVIISLQFIGYTIALAPIPEVAALAMFIAGSVTAFVGYLLRKHGADVNSVSLYVAISLALSLIGTSLLLDGFALTIAYAVEVLAIYILSLSLATAKRSIIVAACLFILPIISGFNDLGSYVWQNGIIHPEALGALSVILTLSFAVVWSLRNSALQSVDWLRKIAGTLLVLGYVFALSTIIVVGESQRVLDSSFVETVLLSLLSGIVIIYILLAVKRVSWRLTALFTLFIPTVTSFVLLNHSAWNSGVFHQPFWAVFLFYIGLISTAVLYSVFAKRESEKSMFTFAYSVVWVILVFGFFFIDRIWNTLLDGDLLRVLNSISFTLLIYLVVNCLMLAKANAGRITAILVMLILPAMLLLASLKFWGWADGMFGVDAVALYVTTTILFLVGTTIRQYKNSVSTDNEKELLDVVGYGLYAVAGFLVFSLVWIMSQTAFASDGVAITVALFIYTVAGLASYSYGRVATSSAWRKIGILLLVTVVLRLGLIDFWGMDPVWKIVTFLGIGILFIATALMERSRDNSIGK